MRSTKILDLIRKGVRRGESAWADFGSGDGAFTRALRELLGSEADVYAVDVDASGLRRQQRSSGSRRDDRRTHFIEADFTQSLDLPPLDGVLLANALHFVEDQHPALKRFRGYLKPSGKLLIVEYDTTRGSTWVPYPVSFHELTRLVTTAGFRPPELLATTPSRYRGQIYSAAAFLGAEEVRAPAMPDRVVPRP